MRQILTCLGADIPLLGANQVSDGMSCDQEALNQRDCDCCDRNGLAQNKQQLM